VFVAQQCREDKGVPRNKLRVPGSGVVRVI
jgi:hypothetical protein